MEKYFKILDVIDEYDFGDEKVFNITLKSISNKYDEIGKMIDGYNYDNSCWIVDLIINNSIEGVLGYISEYDGIVEIEKVDNDFIIKLIEFVKNKR